MEVVQACSTRSGTLFWLGVAVKKLSYVEVTRDSSSRRGMKNRIQLHWSEDVFHHGPLHHAHRAAFDKALEDLSKDHPGRPP